MSLWMNILIGIVSGVVASLIVIAARSLYQLYLDKIAEWPFKVVTHGLRFNPVGSGQQVRVRFLNRASLSVNVIVQSLDANGHGVNGSRIFDPNGHFEIGNMVTVQGRSWREFYVEGPTLRGQPPQDALCFQCWFFTWERAKERTVKINYVSPPVGNLLPNQAD